MVEHICDRVAVMYVGKLVELADTEELFFSPLAPVHRGAALGGPEDRSLAAKARIVLQGEVADVSNPPSGCYFHPRCPYAIDRCRTEAPELRDLGTLTGGVQQVACHRAEELTLQGVPQ